MTNCITHHHACDCREALFKQLIWALAGYSNPDYWRDYCENVYRYPHGYTGAQRVLGSLPSDLLEREQKREAVIQAAIALMSDASGELNGVMHPLEIALDDAVGELQALDK